jgi:hypothetical protein
MYDHNVKKLLLGNKVIAARWLPYAKVIFNNTQKIGLYTRTVVVDPVNNVTIRVITQGAKSIYIKAEPPVRTFVGVPYDTYHINGWGGDFVSEGVLYAYEDPKTPFPSEQLFAYGDPTARTNRTVGIAVEPGEDYRLLRQAELRSNYKVPSNEEVQYGVTNWMNGQILISWDGMPSRFCQTVHDHYGTVYNRDCDTYFSSWPKVGTFVSNGDSCGIYDTPWQSSVNKTTYVNYSYDSGSTADMSEGVFFGTSYDYVNYETKAAFSNKIYKDGKVLHEVPPQYVVTGACIINLRKIAHIQAIVGLFSSYHGIYKEYYYLCALGSTDYKLIELETDDYDFHPETGLPQVFGGAYYNIREERYSADSGLNDRPYRNTTLWSFNSDGTQAVAIRDYSDTDPINYELYGTIAVITDRRIVVMDITFDEFSRVTSPDPTPEIILDKRSGMSDSYRYFKENDLYAGRDEVNYPTEYKRNYGGSVAISVDYYNDEIFTAQVYVTMERYYYNNRDTRYDALLNAHEELRFIKGTTLYRRVYDHYDSFDDYWQYRSFYPNYVDEVATSPVISIQSPELKDGDTVLLTGYTTQSEKWWADDTGGEVYDPGMPCLGETTYTKRQFFYIHHIDLRQIIALTSHETRTDNYKKFKTISYYVPPENGQPGFGASEAIEVLPRDEDIAVFYRQMTVAGKTFIFDESSPISYTYYPLRVLGDIWDTSICPKAVGALAPDLRTFKYRLGTGILPSSTYASGADNSHMQWVELDGLLYMVVGLDPLKPLWGYAPNKFMIVDKTTGDILFDQNLDEVFSIATFYKSTDVDTEDYTTRLKNLTINDTNNPNLIYGGFGNIGVI